MKFYNKLVRDKVCDIIRSNGQEPIAGHIREEDFGSFLLEKLREEVSEYVETQSPMEFADILEVIQVLAERHGGWLILLTMRAQHMERQRECSPAALEDCVRQYAQSGTVSDLAAVLGMVKALAKQRGLQWQTLMEIKRRKYEQRGGFDRRVILIAVY